MIIDELFPEPDADDTRRMFSGDIEIEQELEESDFRDLSAEARTSINATCTYGHHEDYELDIDERHLRASSQIGKVGVTTDPQDTLSSRE
jgi:hypothetical protein